MNFEPLTTISSTPLHSLAETEGIHSAARGAIKAQTQTAIGLAILLFNWIKPYTVSPEQWIQCKSSWRWANEQTIIFNNTALQDLALKWYYSVKARWMDNKDW